MNFRRLKAGILTAAVCLSFVSCGQNTEGDVDDVYKAQHEASASQADTESKTESKAANTEKDVKPVDSAAESEPAKDDRTGTATVHLVCAGDNLIHDNIYVDCQKDDGSYDFTKCYEPCRRLIEGADVAILNQETLVNNLYEPSTYPVFSTPTEDGDAVVDLGFNVISMSNNHVLDKGADGLINSLDYWDSKPVVHYGAYRNEADSEDIKTMEVNGVKFAFLGYMEHTNGFFLDDDDDVGKVVYLEEEDVIKRQVEKANEMADVVVVSCHFGTEIENEINDQQRYMAPKLVEWGADLIIGTQAHALSTCEYIDKPEGGKAFCYYGLGNFFHTMYDANSLVGILGDLDVVVDFDTKEVSFENVKAIPVISHFEGVAYDSMWYNCVVYPMKDYTDELMSKHLMYGDGFSWDSVNQSISYVPDEFLSIE